VSFDKVYRFFKIVGFISAKMHLITFEIGRFYQNQFYFKETLKYTNQQFFLFTNIMRKLY